MTQIKRPVRSQIRVLMPYLSKDDVNVLIFGYVATKKKKNNEILKEYIKVG